MGCGNDTRTLPPTKAPNVQTLVCRHQPAWVIGSKACPGLRSGMNGSRPQFVIPAKAGIQGRWRGGTHDTQTRPTTKPRFSYLGVPAAAGMSDSNESMSRDDDPG